MALEFVRTLFLSLCFFVPAADSNDCDDGTFCLNRGTCYYYRGVEKRCQCSTGYGGKRCELVDSCDRLITCYNGGSCYLNNSLNVAACRCPVHFTGYHCESQISTTTTTSHVTNTPSTTTANNQPQTSDGAMSTTRNPACAKFDPTVRPCRDASVCSKPHMKEVLCPDPDQAHYCPVTCGCCVPETAEMIG